MLATFGLERLESGLRRDTVSATDVAKFLEQAEAADVDTLARRVLNNGGISYWESGMDMKFGDDIFDNFRAYQRRLLRTYTAMSGEFGFRVLDGRMPIDAIQEELRRQVGSFLDEAEASATIDPELRSCG